MIDNKRIVKRREKAANNKLKAEFKLTDSQAKYAYDKTLKKTGNVDKAKKAEEKIYYKSMVKGKGGLSGSVSDLNSGGRASKYYDHLKSKKGKDYVNKLEKRYKRRLGTGLALSAAGAAASYGYLIYSMYKSR